MGQPPRKKAEHNAGAFLGPDLLIPVPMRTLSDDYHDAPTEPPDDREPTTGAPGPHRSHPAAVVPSVGSRSLTIRIAAREDSAARDGVPEGGRSVEECLAAVAADVFVVEVVPDRFD